MSNTTPNPLLQPNTLIPALLATLLSVHGLRKRSLSPSGAIAAFIAGTLMLSGGLRAFGVGLLGLYLIGSRATKYGKSRKARIEEDYHAAGYRTASQVWCNCASGLVACVVWNGLFAPLSLHAQSLKWIGADRALLELASLIVLTVKGQGGIDSDNGFFVGIGNSQEGWCPIGRSVGDGGLSRGLIFAAIGHFACCLGDTLASELGVLSKAKPRLITTWKAVPAGTNGGVSVGGTIGSIGGGMMIGVLMGASIVFENTRSCSLLDIFRCSLLGAVLGCSGSLIDSILGATIQETRIKNGKISQKGVLINGLNLLSNNQVNLISSTLSAVIGGWISFYYF